ncbi:hypothetical protein [Ornithinimicrobium kibberense]|uniref:hypothetical protein n=1 Tax=Ornithinimicrobium kibberense TaxID=282060 RepID=UPI003619169A
MGRHRLGRVGGPPGRPPLVALGAERLQGRDQRPAELWHEDALLGPGGGVDELDRAPRHTRHVTGAGERHEHRPLPEGGPQPHPLDQAADLVDVGQGPARQLVDGHPPLQGAGAPQGDADAGGQLVLGHGPDGMPRPPAGRRGTAFRGD